MSTPTKKPMTKEERAADLAAARAIRPVKVSISATSLKDAIYESDKRHHDANGKTFISNRTAMDIAECVAGHKAADFNRWHKAQSTMYLSRASLVRQWVSIGDVRKYIAQLVEEGWLVAVPGTSDLFGSKYGVQSNATYYFRKEIYDALVSVAQRRHSDAAEAKAERLATEMLVENHRDEHRAMVEAILAGQDPNEV